jgi:hypothetical protein
MKIDYRILSEIKRKSFHLVILIVFFVLKGCSSSFNNQQFSPESLITANSIKANLEFLASDELEGREATTRGEKLAALFISSELKKYGVKPFYNDYLQGYDLNVTSVDPGSKAWIIDSAGNKKLLNYYEDFFVNRRSCVTTNGKYNIVFVGYGITAPEFNYDNYANLDVAGKIVVLYNSEPYSTDTSYFNGEKDSKYASTNYKISRAKELGAAGIISFQKFYFKKWNLFKQYFNGNLMLPPKEVSKEKLPELIFNKISISGLLDSEKFSFEEIQSLIDNNKPFPVFNLKKEVEIDLNVTESVKKSYNVVGIIEGNDSLKKNEFVAIGAHLDHLGIIEGEVYNGADDDGSGIAAILEVAKTFAETRLNKRSILIVFHSSEEEGLHGSEYFTDNFDSIKKIIAQINIDMVGRENIDTIYSVGSGKLSSEFQKLVEDANYQTVNFVFNYKFDDPNDREKIYYRSDHYNYAKYGIPIVFFYDYMLEDYHKDSDEVDKINFEKIRKTAILVYNIALRTANLDQRLKIDNKEVTETAN